MKLTMFYILLGCAYLIGSIASAVIVCRILNLPDPRNQGSGNAGTTNVLRIGGKGAAILVLIADIIKGYIPVIFAKLVGMDGLAASLIGVAVVLGHIYPIFFKFKGGKGFASMLGVILALSWPLAIAAIVVWLIVALITRYASLASILAAVSAPAINEFVGNSHYFIGFVILAFIVVVKHWDNIDRLLNGKERKIGQRVNH